MIDLYCERTGPELLSEPLNALTNGAFIIAAILLFFQARNRNVLSVDTGLLITLIFAIGVGSGLFHLYATRTTLLADVLPILFFQVSFLVIYSRSVIEASWRVTGMLLLGYVILTFLAGTLPGDLFNGTLRYAPAFIFICLLGSYHYQEKKNGRPYLLMAAGVFLLSMTFRSIDQSVCASLPIGTHFLWHVLNAVVLYLCTYVVLINKNKA